MISATRQLFNLKLAFGIFLALLIPIAGTVMTDAPIIWPVSALIYNLGLVFSFGLAPNKIARIIGYSIIAAIFFIIESSFFFSYYLQNAGFNEAFFYHIRPDLLYAGVKEHLPILLGITLCLFCFLVMASSALARDKSRKAQLAPLALGLVALGLFISPSVKALVIYVEKNSTPQKNTLLFENFTELLGPKIAVEFTKPAKPNVVLIYAESLEQRFFDENLFPGLVPNLKNLRNRSVDFSNISQGPGAGWTVGGIVASQCGYPLTGSQGVNDNDLSIFDQFLPNATCLGDLLQKDGYHLAFIGGADARFAGKDEFLRSHGYEEITDLNILLEFLGDKSYLNNWGIFDDTLFDYGFEKFQNLSSAGSPFLLTLLTLDPHGPIGYTSKSCSTYGSGDNSSLNSFHCSDQVISSFIEKIRNSPYSKNTIIIVLSDHLSMRNKATPLLEASQAPQRLTLFINTPDAKTGENNNPGVHYDIAPTILDFIGYNIKGQMGFGLPLTQGPGYLPGKFGEDKWREQIPGLMAIGTTLWDNEVTLDQNGINFNDAKFSLVMGGREFNLRSWGATDVPASNLFIFDNETLKLEKIKTYAFDKGLTEETLGQELLEHKEKLALVISRVMNLPGFIDPRNNPERWAFFFGKPGGELFTGGLITGDIFIPYKLIQDLRNSKMDDRIIRQRKNLLSARAGEKTARP